MLQFEHEEVKALEKDTNMLATLHERSIVTKLIGFSMEKGISDIQLVEGADSPIFRLGRKSQSIKGMSEFSELKNILMVKSKFEQELLQPLYQFIANKLILFDENTPCFGESDYQTEEQEYILRDAQEEATFEIISKWPKQKSARYTFSFSNYTIRCSFYLTKGKRAVSIRVQPQNPRALRSKELNFDPMLIEKLTDRAPGLYVIAGGPSCGKSSTLASIVQEFVETSDYHIRLLEDPIEYSYKAGSGFLTQQWVNKVGDVETYQEAIEDALTQDVNVLAFGELRDALSIRQALAASSLNMVVLATIHAPDTSGAIRRILEAYDPVDREGALKSLHNNLRAVVSQQFKVSNVKTTGEELTLGKVSDIKKEVRLAYESATFNSQSPLKSCLSSTEELKTLSDQITSKAGEHGIHTFESSLARG